MRKIKQDIKIFFEKRYILARRWLIAERKLKLVKSFNDESYKKVEVEIRENISKIREEIKPYNLIFDRLTLIEKLYLYKVLMEKHKVKDFCRDNNLNQYQISKLQKAIEQKYNNYKNI